MYGTMRGSYDDLRHAVDMENPLGTTDTEVTQCPSCIVPSLEG